VPERKEIAMPKGYLIAHIRVHDAEAFEEFKSLSGAAMAGGLPTLTPRRYQGAT
jgi:hypothetical protein